VVNPTHRKDKDNFNINNLVAGWRRSADGPLLCPRSLLTGNFTGNFTKSRLLARQRLQILAAVAGLPTQIPYSTEQGIISTEQGIPAQEQGILPAKPISSSDEVFGTHSHENPHTDN
jgi:hypothetical protein